MAKRGSIPLEQPEMMLMVPVGATVVVVALRMWPAPLLLSKTLPGKLGKLPRFSARAAEAARDSRWIKAMTSSATLTASAEL